MKLLLAGTIDGWSDLSLSRSNQTFRNGLARDLQIIANQIANLSANEGSMSGLRWRLEPDAKPAAAEDEADEAA